MPGLGGGIARALGSDDVNVIAKVKNPAIQKAIDSALSSYSRYTQGEQGALSDYINRYLSQQGQFEKNVGEESGAVGQFYTGEMANRLADLRRRREGAVNAAADVGVRQALANVNRSRLGQEGGTSSYDQRLAMGAVLPIRTQAALDAANQERADLGYVTGNQLGLIGQRANLANALAGYGLVPYTTARQMQGQELGLLGGITNLDQANKFYGLKKEKNTFADIADTIDSSILSAASMYSSLGSPGMGGGGGRAARGGLAVGPGDAHSDSIPINVSDGEFIVPASAVRMPGVLPMLQRIRAAGLASEGRGPLSERIQMNRAEGWREPRMGFAGGGLSGEAMQLRDRAAQDQNWQWMPATMVGQGVGNAGWGMPGATATGASPLPGMPSAQDWERRFMQLYGPQAVPSNFGELTPAQQREYTGMYGRARAMEAGWGGAQNNPYE